MIKLCDKLGNLIADITENSIDYIVEEERNGLFELKLIYPAGYNNYNDLIKENILITNATNTLLNQKFRIYNTRKTLSNKIEVYARHISYDLLSDFIENLDIENQSCEYCLNQLFSNSQFSRHFKGVSDIVNAQDFKVSRSNPLNAIAGQRGSIIDTFGTGAEILRDNETIKVLNRRGHDNGIVIEYGENMTGFDCEEDTTNLITRIYPYVKKNNNNTEDIITLNERFVDSPRINNYSHPYIASIDLSDKFEQDEEITQSKLRLETEKYFIKTKCDIPKINFKINFVLIKKLGLNLCDLVTIKHKLYGIDTQAKVIKAVYNPRLERYISMELGEPKASLGDLISSGGSNNSGNNEEENKPPIIDDNNFPNTLPNIPILSAKAIGLGSIELTWTFESKIFYKYELYASKVKDFSPNAFDLIFKGQASAFLHVVKPNEIWYYRVRAVNSHGKATEFSTQVKVETRKNDDFETYFSSLAVENLVASIFSVNYMEAGIIKGNWIDAKQLSVTDGNGKRTLDIDSFGRVRLNVTELSILSKAVETEESSTLKINNAKVEAINSATADTNKKINNLQVGGRNYALNTALETTVVGENRTNQTINICNINGDILIGKQVTVSFDWNVTGDNISGTFRAQTGANHWASSSKTISVNNNNKNGKEIYTCTWNTDRGGFSNIQARLDNFIGILTINNFKVELGNKATDWSPAPEDISKEILDITTEKINQAKADIKITTDSIAQKVSNTESTINTINGKVNSHESRIASTEQKITSTAIINTVQSTINQAKTDAINSSNNSTDNKLKNYATTSKVTKLEQSVDGFKYKVEKSNSVNILSNSSFRSKHSNIEFWIAHKYDLDSNNNAVLSVSTYDKSWACNDSIADTLMISNSAKVSISKGELGARQYIKTGIGKTYTFSFKSTGRNLGLAYCRARGKKDNQYGDLSYKSWTSCNSLSANAAAWDYITITFTAEREDTIVEFGFKGATNGSDPKLLVSQPIVNSGEIVAEYSPSANEINASTTTINETGLRCDFSDGSYASMGANGFRYFTQGMSSPYQYITFSTKISRIRNGTWTNVTLPACFKNKNVNTDFAVQAWAGAINSNDFSEKQKDAVRNLFIEIGTWDKTNRVLKVRPCLQKIGVATMTHWGWDSSTTTSGNTIGEGSIDIILIAQM